MSSALDALFEAARNEWSDPRATAIMACRALIELTDTDWTAEGREAVQQLRRKRRDSALLLAVSEAALWDEPSQAAAGLRQSLAALEDTSWALGVAKSVLAADGIVHVASLGESTMLVLEELSRMSEAAPLVHTHLAAVARGLGILDVAVAVADPAHADIFLLPVAALHEDRIWTTPALIDTASSFVGDIIAVHHPLAVMSPLSRQQFRPAPLLVGTRIQHPG